MFLRIGRGVAITLLMAQEPIAQIDLDYLATKDGSNLAMVTVVAAHVDGTPVRNGIWCDGTWFKHADERTVTRAWQLRFRPDARGAVIFNPHLDDEQIHCFAEEKGMRGEVIADLDRDSVVNLILNRKAYE